MQEEQSGLEKELGKNEVFFLPYLMGERSPHNEVNARGAFIGMRPITDEKGDDARRFGRGSFALRDCMEVAKGNGIKVTCTRICGGGAKVRFGVKLSQMFWEFPWKLR